MSIWEKIRRKVENVKNFLAGLPILVLGGIIALAFIVVIVILIMAINVLESQQDSAQTSETAVIETEADTETAESTETVENNESAEAETAQSSDSEQVLLSGIHIFFDGAWIQTYSREDAFNSEAVNLNQFSNDPSVLVQALISYNQPVSRIRVWVENESGGSISDEYFLYSDNNWSAEMDLSSITGTVIVAISVADTNVPANNTYEYFKLFIPETSEETIEETEQASTTQAEGNNANASGTQIFLNGVSVTGYASFEEAIQTPVNMAAGDVTIYAGNKPQNTSRILVQIGNDSKNAVAIDVTPLSESNNWTQTVNVTEFQGSMLVFNITSELGFAAETTNQFVAISLQ